MTEQQLTPHQKDIALIAERMYREARSRRWCSDFDEIVDELNERLSVKIAKPPVKWTVTMELEFMAVDRGAAQERVSDFIRTEHADLIDWEIDSITD